MKKTKSILKWSYENFVSFVCLVLIATAAGTYSMIKVCEFVANPVPFGEIAVVNVARASVEKEIPMKLWILQTVNDAGLDINKVECLINHEGGFNDNAFHINTNGTIDIGVYEFNSVHLKNISIKCMADYKCATLKFIEMVKKNGNFNAWNGYTANCR